MGSDSQTSSWAEKMRVLMLSEYPYSEAEQGHGGVMQATYQLLGGISDLDAKNVDLHVITTTDLCSKPSVRKENNITYHFIPKSRLTLGQITLTPLRFFVYSLRLVREVKPDLIHGQGSIIFLVSSLLLGSPSIQTVHGLYVNELAAIPRQSLSLLVRIKFAIKIVVERWYIRRVKNLIAITSQIVEFANSLGNKDVKVFEINNAIDNDFFNVPAVSKKFGLSDDSPIKILFVAAITPRKGLHILVPAFKKVVEQNPNICLTVVGIWDWAPEYVQEQFNETRELQAEGKVLFTGGVKREQLVQHFAEADIFVLPSFAESAPMVISQAMCIGLPIVATNVGGIPEMINHEYSGLMVPPGDVEALAAAILQLVESPEARQKIADVAREIGFVRYHPTSIARATLDAYDAVING